MEFLNHKPFRMDTNMRRYLIKILFFVAVFSILLIAIASRGMVIPNNDQLPIQGAPSIILLGISAIGIIANLRK